MTNEELVFEIQSGRNVRENLGLLYEQNEGLITKWVRAVCGHIEFDDAKQEAFFGLKRAVDGWNPESGAKFVTYAEYCIRGRVIRYNYTHGTTIRRTDRTAARLTSIDKFKQKYRESHSGQDPTDQQIMEGLKLSKAEYKIAMTALQQTQQISISQLIVSESEESRNSMESLFADPHNEIDLMLDDLAKSEAAAELWKEVDRLPDRERDLIKERYIEGVSQSQLAKDWNCARTSILRWEKSALDHLRVRRCMEDIAAAYSMAYKGGTGAFKRTWTSSTERAAIKLYEVTKRPRHAVI